MTIAAGIIYPTGQGVEFYGFQAMGYYLKRFLLYYADYPWSIRLLYGLIMACILTMMVVFVLFMRKIRQNRKANKAYNAARKQLYNGFYSILISADKPDGTNINRDCGSTHIQHLMEFVVKNRCDCGLAFDGDADRCIAVDEKGALLDGDRQLAIFARSMKEQGLLDKDTAVITAMSSLGLRKYAAANGIKLVSSGAGARYVLERMLEGGYKLGGEPNGHIIFLGDSGTGDGQLAGARLMSIMKRSGLKLSQLSEDIPAYPQVKLNVKISPHFKELWKNEKSVTELIESFEKELGEDGRIMVRESGKEPIVRIMAEGSDFGRINDMAVEIAQHIKEKCSAGE